MLHSWPQEFSTPPLRSTCGLELSTLNKGFQTPWPTTSAFRGWSAVSSAPHLLPACLLPPITLDLCLPDHLMFWAACSLGYFGFLRLSEFTVPSLASFSPSYHLGVQVISVDSPSAPWWGDVPHWLRQILASVNIPGNFSSHSFCIRATTVAARNGVPDHLMHLLLCSWSTALEHWSTAFPPWSSLPFPVCSPFCCFFSSSLLRSHQFPSRAASTSAGSGLPLLSLLVLQC